MTDVSPAPTLPGAIGSEGWRALGEYLEREDMLLLSAEDRGRFLREWREIAALERRLDGVVTIGLVGGTGVGKSTFINALAGAEISSSGDRRPTTDRVIVYRHVASSWPAGMPTADLSQPPVLHQNSRLENVVLLDFPDFDSAEATHAEILGRYLRHLDILFVVVDDMKYGDRRLFDLLASVTHNPENVYALLNKVDLLERRYGERWREVAGSILEDLREKISRHAGFSMSSSRAICISARSRLLNATAGAADSAEGDFARVEAVLDEFREEKRRKSAKAMNLESRREDLRENVRTVAIRSEVTEVIAFAEAMIHERAEELQRIGAAISPEILTDEERRYARQRHLRRVAPTWGFPFALIWQFFTFLFRRRRRSSTREITGLGERVRLHYQACLDGVANLERALELELRSMGLASPRPGTSPRREAGGSSRSAANLALELGRRLSEVLSPPVTAPSGRRRLLFHLPALGCFLFALWALFYPLVRYLLTGEGAVGGVSGELVLILLRGLHPLSIIGLLVGVLLSYALTTFWLGARQGQRLEETITRAERWIQDEIHDHAHHAIDATRSRVLAFRSEKEDLERWLAREPD